jgi:hypothetical protein
MAGAERRSLRPGRGSRAAATILRSAPFALAVLVLLAPASAPALAGPVHRGVVPSPPSLPGPGGASPLEAGVPTENNWSQRPIPNFSEPFGRSYGAVAYDPLAGDGVIFGGKSVSGATLNDTWVNDGDFPGFWANFSDQVNGSPPPLTNASFAYDRSDGYFVLFGGRFANGTDSGETWEFRGLSDWVDVTSYQARSPPAQAGAGFAYDLDDATTVLLNGVGNASTWTFHDGNWSVAPTAVTPSARHGEAFGYDPLDHALLLFGGTVGTERLNDTWEYSAGAWQALSPPKSPPASAWPVASYDPHGPGELLYLGDQSLSTWEFANDRWTAVSASGPGAPAPRLGAELYFDKIVDHDILFGGVEFPNGTPLNDDWGWSVPVAPVDPTLAPVPFSVPELVGIAAIAAVPVALAWFLRRRPPRRLPVSVPRPASGSASST